MLIFCKSMRELNISNFLMVSDEYIAREEKKNMNYGMDSFSAYEKAKEEYLEYVKYSILADRKNKYAILVKNNKYVSMVTVTTIGRNRYYLSNLETNPNYRNRGYGTELLCSLIDSLKEKGSFEIIDCCVKDNYSALRCHEKAGFQKVLENGFSYVDYEYHSNWYGLQYKYVV